MRTIKIDEIKAERKKAKEEKLRLEAEAKKAALAE